MDRHNEKPNPPPPPLRIPVGLSPYITNRTFFNSVVLANMMSRCRTAPMTTPSLQYAMAAVASMSGEASKPNALEPLSLTT